MKLNILHLKMMVRTVLVGALLCSVNAAMSQVNFTQTTTNDFMKGSGLNVTIADNAVSLQGKMASVSDWVAATNLPQALKGHQTTTWRNYVYLVGGHNGSNYVNNVYRATQQDNGISGWSSLNTLPLALKDMAVVATQTQLLVIGGHNNDSVSNRIYAAKLNDDGSIGSWNESSVTLPEARWGMSAVMCMDHIYIIGGATADNAATNTVYCLKLNADGVVVSISQVNGLPEARNGHAVAVYDSKLIVTGGYDAMQTTKNTVYTAAVNLDGTLGAWQTKTALPVAVYNHTTVCSNDILTVIGGHDGTLPSNKFYYADLSANTWIWTLSDVMLPERYTEGASFAFGDKIFFCGGQNISNALSNYTRFMAVTTTEAPVGKSAFIGKPFYVGAPKTLHQLVYTLNYTASNTSYEILYRMAGPDKVFGNWISSGSNSPAVINQSNSYIQYMFRFTANGNDNLSLDDVTLTVSGFTQLAGNLNDMSSLTLAGSPYWVTSDISFTTGVHNIEAGVVIYFRANTGLNIGQASVNFNGTATQHILLTYEDEEAGMWNGVYYQDASDNNGLTSVMSHTTIEKAGNGDNDANLRLHYTNQPTINNCTFTNADGMGLRLCNSHPTISGTVMSDNSFSGLDLESATPTCNACVMSGNLYGIYYRNNNFGATLQGVTTTGNTYGLYSCTPDRTFTLDAAALSFVNNGTDIAVAGGRIANDQTWNLFPNGYALLGNVEVYGGTPKLTIAPGNTIKGAVNTSLYIGNGSSQGGMLYAVGTATDSIVFTSLNGEVGGWNGLNFRDGSDYNSLSSMRFCKVEKANTNIYCANTTQPGIMWCTIQDAVNTNIDLNSSNLSIDESIIKDAPIGLRVNSSNPSLVSVVFDNHSEACIWHQNACVITYYTCTLKNSHFGIRYETPNYDFLNNVNITYLNNEYNIAMPGGDINENRLWNENSYAILGNVCVLTCRLTLSPGVTLRFAEDAKMQVSDHRSPYYTYDYYGELYAVGTEEQPITFTSMNGEPGGWNGLYFHDNSDNVEGKQSFLQYCIFENGNEYNLHMNSTNQPSQIENCIFQNALGYGVYFYNLSDVEMSNCQVQNNGSHGIKSQNALIGVHDVQVLSNGGYGMYYTPSSMDSMDNVIIEGNQDGQIAIEGGDINANRSWSAYEYHILGDLYVLTCRLTLSPGVTLRFAEDAKMQVSDYRSPYYTYDYYGELYAVGTEEQPITFTSINGESGGWNGLVFHNHSDDVEGQQSTLQHCIIENGNEYNLHLSGTNQPSVIEDCIFRNSAQKGVYMHDSRDTIRNCVFENNAEYALFYNSAPNVGVLENLSFNGNLLDGVAVNGGHFGSDCTWNACTYFILEDLRIGHWVQGYNAVSCRLTLLPGTVLKFAEGKRMDVSGHWGNYYADHYGELWAVGTEEQPIVFTSINGEIGGWVGLAFNSQCLSFPSMLSHCIIENGNEYNVFIGGTSNITLTNCSLEHSNSYGLRIDNCSPTIIKSIIKDNASYGVYLNSNSNPTIGGNYVNGCSIYHNGEYEIYQNGGSNFNMPYNYIGAVDSLYIQKHVLYDKGTDDTKGRVNVYPVSWLPMHIGEYDCEGRLYYDNNANKPLAGVGLAVKDFQGETLAETTVDNNGDFSFDDLDLSVANKIEVTTGIDFPNAITSVSALFVKRHFAHLMTLEGNHAVVADVNKSKTINGTDALLIQRHVAHLISTFPTGDLLMATDTAYSNGNQFTMNLSALCYGDVDGRYSGFNRDNGLELELDGHLVIESKQAFDIPVRINAANDVAGTTMCANDVAAITLRLSYPDEYLDIEDVILSATGESLMHGGEAGQLNISWCNLNSISLAAGDELLLIKTRAKDLSLLEEEITFTLEGYSELNDVEGNKLPNIMLLMPTLTTKLLSMTENTTNAALSIYPNPTKGETVLRYQLPDEGCVSIALFDMMGMKVVDLGNAFQGKGQHEVRFNANSLDDGFYYCRFVFTGKNEFVKTVKVVVEK